MAASTSAQVGADFSTTTALIIGSSGCIFACEGIAPAWLVWVGTWTWRIQKRIPNHQAIPCMYVPWAQAADVKDMARRMRPPPPPSSLLLFARARVKRSSTTSAPTAVPRYRGRLSRSTPASSSCSRSSSAAAILADLIDVQTPCLWG